jgi:hypothetical protein
VISNDRTFLEIARDAHRSSKEAEAQHRRPNPSGTGSIITFDPDRESFKHSLIAIAFVGAFLDAILYWAGRDILGKSQYEKRVTEVSSRYEHQLAVLFAKLGIEDDQLVADSKRFREARKEVMHEKAIPVEELGKKGVRLAQKEAANALSVANRVVERLGIAV